MTDTLDIVKLVEDYPLTKFSDSDYQSKIVNKLRNKFNTNEQNLFLASFYCYLNVPKKDFVIDLDKTWRWLDYSQKIRAKEQLTGNFTENVDYKSTFSGEKVGNHGGKKRETIKMTVRCFKLLCLRARTDKAYQIHDYYVNLEEITHEVAAEESEILRNQLLVKDQELLAFKEYESTFVDITPHENKPTNYLLEVADGVYKYGETGDILQRLATHRCKLNKDLTIIHLISVKSTKISRKIENAISKYARNSKISSSFKTTKTEIVRIDKVGLALLIKKIEQLTLEYNVTSNEEEINLELTKQNTIDKMQKLADTFLSSGMSGSEMAIVLSRSSPQVHDLKEIKLKETKIPKKYIIPDGTKCNSCGNHRSDKEMGTNRNTEQLYSSCEICRTKRASKLAEFTQGDRDKADEEHRDKWDKIEKSRRLLLDSKELIKCCRSPSHFKLPTDFGICKRSNILYKTCKACRGVPEDEDSIGECSKCSKPNQSDFKTCEDCRKMDKKVRELAKKTPVHECQDCKKQMEPSINLNNKKYHKNCDECRKKRKKYTKTEEQKKAANAHKKEYYKENKESIREKQKAHYDKNSSRIIEQKKIKNQQN
jgi:hypothetical protein